MDIIEWTDDLRLGIAFIDESHQKLVSLANEFIDGMRRGQPPCTLTLALTRLREQALADITTKENILSQMRYIKRSAQAMGDERLKVSIRDFHQHIKKTCSVNDIEVQNLKRTLVNHIHNSNQAITDCTASLKI
ncbi:hypothetical protein [uncultured Pseudodesulfovibrio sp.]|uniref:bacteriohemerythrin n=1 Tax=uncultured Pseudodesulfovibrio sp. TaxID=2035858 RepID=UPI0029C7D155|nr:hypothetical protein [uncultured Pseudodesulfovibrio sp.]